MKKYKIIYADPPWRYDQKRLQGVAEKHYATMNTNDICALPVAEFWQIKIVSYSYGLPFRCCRKH